MHDTDVAGLSEPLRCHVEPSEWTWKHDAKELALNIVALVVNPIQNAKYWWQLTTHKTWLKSSISRRECKCWVCPLFGFLFWRGDFTRLPIFLSSIVCACLPVEYIISDFLTTVLLSYTLTSWWKWEGMVGFPLGSDSFFSSLLPFLLMMLFFMSLVGLHTSSVLVFLVSVSSWLFAAESTHSLNAWWFGVWGGIIIWATATMEFRSAAQFSQLQEVLDKATLGACTVDRKTGIILKVQPGLVRTFREESGTELIRKTFGDYVDEQHHTKVQHFIHSQMNDIVAVFKFHGDVDVTKTFKIIKYSESAQVVALCLTEPESVQEADLGNQVRKAGTWVQEGMTEGPEQAARVLDVPEEPVVVNAGGPSLDFLEREDSPAICHAISDALQNCINPVELADAAEFRQNVFDNSSPALSKLKTLTIIMDMLFGANRSPEFGGRFGGCLFVVVPSRSFNRAVYDQAGRTLRTSDNNYMTDRVKNVGLESAVFKKAFEQFTNHDLDTNDKWPQDFEDEKARGKPKDGGFFVTRSGKPIKAAAKILGLPSRFKWPNVGTKHEAALACAVELPGSVAFVKSDSGWLSCIVRNPNAGLGGEPSVLCWKIQCSV